MYAKCLAPDIEYKTVIVTKNMSSRELICLLLSKCRMKHRDPKVIKTLNVRIEDNNHFYILSCFTLQWMSLLRRQGYQSRGPWSLRMKLGQHNWGHVILGGNVNSAFRWEKVDLLESMTVYWWVNIWWYFNILNMILQELRGNFSVVFSLNSLVKLQNLSVGTVFKKIYFPLGIRWK